MHKESLKYIEARFAKSVKCMGKSFPKKSHEMISSESEMKLVMEFLADIFKQQTSVPKGAIRL